MSDAPSLPDTAERKRRQRNRSLALAAILGGLVVVFYAITIVQLSDQSAQVDAERAAEQAASSETSVEGGADE